jgi:hypothetical protein
VRPNLLRAAVSNVLTANVPASAAGVVDDGVVTLDVQNEGGVFLQQAADNTILLSPPVNSLELAY